MTNKPGIVLNINKSARNLLFREGDGNVIRIRLHENNIQFKSAKRLTPHEGEEAVTISSLGVFKLQGALGAAYLRALTKIGFSNSAVSIFSMLRETAGWYSLKREPELTSFPKSQASLPLMKIELNGNPSDFGVVIKAKPAKVAKVAKEVKPAKSAVELPAPAMIPTLEGENYVGFERRIFASAAIVTANQEAPRVGRPKAEVVEAQATLMRFETLYTNVIGGGPNLRTLKTQIMDGISTLNGVLLLVDEALTRQDNLAAMAREINSHAAAFDVGATKAEQPAPVSVETADAPETEQVTTDEQPAPVTIVEEPAADASALEAVDDKPLIPAPETEMQEPGAAEDINLNAPDDHLPPHVPVTLDTPEAVDGDHKPVRRDRRRNREAA